MSETRYPSSFAWVLETTYGVYPRGTWGFAGILGDDAAHAATVLADWERLHPSEYRLFNNTTNEVVWPDGRIVSGAI